MEGSDNDSEIKVFQDVNYGKSSQKVPNLNTLSHISDFSKEMEGVNDSSLDCLAKELFKEDSNSKNLSSNKKKNNQFNYKAHSDSEDLDSAEKGVILGDLPECSGLVDFIDKTLTLSNQNILQALSETLDNKKDDPGRYSLTFHDLLEGFKYDCHVIYEQLAGVKNIVGKSDRQVLILNSALWFNVPKSPIYGTIYVW